MSGMKPSPAVEADKQKPSLELNIGTNIFRNTNGVLRIQGKEQIVLEHRPDDHHLLLTMDLYDGEGKHVAHLRRNTWAVNVANRFAVATTSASSLSLFSEPRWLKVSDSHTGDTVLELTLTSYAKIHLVSGKFYSHKGQLVEITSHLCRIGSGVTMFGDVFESRGGIASIG